MVSSTLTIIENWFKEPSSDADKPLLLSKLAVLELCGWLEERIDEFIREVDEKSLKDSKWTEDNIISINYGFNYDKHLRRMLCQVLGEFKVRQLEIKFEDQYPNEINDIKSDLASLWRLRCNLAHADLGAHKTAQTSINAPSWTKNRYRIVSKRLNNFKLFILAEMG